ncbi:MAG: hypothetical protein AVDCRST_MAG52-3566, partial [uncultured Blastococcus sp.]
GVAAAGPARSGTVDPRAEACTPGDRPDPQPAPPLRGAAPAPPRPQRLREVLARAQRRRPGHVGRRRGHRDDHRLRRRRHPGPAGDQRAALPRSDAGDGGPRRPGDGEGDPRHLAEQPGPAGGAAAVAAPVRVGGRGPGGRQPGRLPRPRPAAAPAVRGRDHRQLVGLRHAVAADDRARGVPAQQRLRAHPARHLADPREVGGRRPPGAHRGVPALPGAGPPHRRPGRGGARRRRTAGRLPPDHSERDLPGALQPEPPRPPRRLREPRAGHRPGPARPAGRARHRRRPLRAGRVGRLHPLEDHRRGGRLGDGRRELHLRQALRRHARALRPLVQARPDAALRPARGREALPQRAPAGPVRGLHPAAVLRCRAAGPPPARHRGDHARARVPPGHGVHLRRQGGRGGRDRRLDHRPGPVDRPPDVGHRHGAPRHQAGQPAGAGPHALPDRLRLRRGAAEPVAPGGRPRQHAAGPGPAHRRRAGLPAGPAAVLRRGDRRGLRGHPRADDALSAAPDAAPAGAGPARGLPPPAPLPAAPGAHPAGDLAAGGPHPRHPRRRRRPRRAHRHHPRVPAV